MDRVFQTVFKFLLIAILGLVFVQAVVRELGELRLIGVLMIASVLAFLYREHGKTRTHSARSTGSGERRRMDTDSDQAGNPSDAESPWT
jgi:hypothetical protein